MATDITRNSMVRFSQNILNYWNCFSNNKNSEVMNLLKNENYPVLKTSRTKNPRLTVELLIIITMNK